MAMLQAVSSVLLPVEQSRCEIVQDAHIGFTARVWACTDCGKIVLSFKFKDGTEVMPQYCPWCGERFDGK